MEDKPLLPESIDASKKGRSESSEMMFWDSYNRRVLIEARRIYQISESLDLESETVSKTHCKVFYSVNGRDFSLTVARPYNEVRSEWKAKKALSPS